MADPYIRSSSPPYLPLYRSKKVVVDDESLSVPVAVVDDGDGDNGVDAMHNGVDEVLKKESSEDEDPSRSWWPEGRLTVCFVHWVHTNVGRHEEFREVLRSTVPSGTHFFGCKKSVDGDENDYMAMLGFPYRIGSWKGLKDRLNLKDGCRQVDAERVAVYFPDDSYGTPRAFVQFYAAVCVVKSSETERFSSSFRAFELAPYLSSADDMWKISEQNWLGV